MFRSIESLKARVTIVVDGKDVEVDATASVAAALLGAGVTTVRCSVVGDQPRGPYCLMGICFECLVTIDGVPNAPISVTTIGMAPAFGTRSLPLPQPTFPPRPSGVWSSKAKVARQRSNYESPWPAAAGSFTRAG